MNKYNEQNELKILADNKKNEEKENDCRNLKDDKETK